MARTVTGIRFARTSQPHETIGVGGASLVLQIGFSDGAWEEVPVTGEYDHPKEPPKLQGLNPSEVAIGDPDTLVVVHGTGFTPDSVITVSGEDIPTNYESPTKVNSIVKPSTVTEPGVHPITVRNSIGESQPLDFEFTEVIHQKRAKSR